MNDRFGRVEDGRGSLGHSATLRFPSHLCRFGICSRKRLRIAESGPTLCLTYALLKMKPRPAFNGLSIGYRAKDFELHRSGSGPNGAKRTLKSVDLVECSLVTVHEGFCRNTVRNAAAVSESQAAITREAVAVAASRPNL